MVVMGYSGKWDKTIGQEKGEIHPPLALIAESSERAILPLKTATREKCSKVKASNSFLKRFDIWVRASQAVLVGGGGVGRW